MRLRTETISILSGMFLSIAGGAAVAGEIDDEGDAFDHPVAAVSDAFEIQLSAGYTQGVGEIAAGMPSVQDISGAGGAFELKLGYRAFTQASFGVYGSAAQILGENSLPDGADVRSATAGVYADYHFRPTQSVDPWIGISTGWRGMWLVPDHGKNTSLQGWEVVRFQGGIDYRVTPDVAIAPVVAAGINVFYTHDDPTTNDYTSIADERASWFFFAGIQGRFDAFGREDSHGEAMQASR